MKFPCVILSVVLLCSCNNARNAKVMLDRLIGTEISLPQHMDRAEAGIISACDVEILNLTPIKFITYYGENECNSCIINNIALWNGIIGSFNNRDVAPIFIFASTDNTDELLIEAKLNLEIPIYIDKYNEFPTLNKQISGDYKYNTFLLDKSDRVVLVGNPLQNASLYNLYKDTIDNMLTHNGIYVPDTAGRH